MHGFRVKKNRQGSDTYQGAAYFVEKAVINLST